MRKYPYIRAWCRLQGSFSTFLENEIARAIDSQAPETAIYRRSDGTWATFDEILSSETKREIQSIIAEMNCEEAAK